MSCNAFRSHSFPDPSPPSYLSTQPPPQKTKLGAGSEVKSSAALAENSGSVPSNYMLVQSSL